MSTPGLLEQLSAAHLLSAAQLAELAALPEARADDPRLLAKVVLQRGWLSRHQINQIAAGRGQELRIGPYVVLERVGEGGMGQVFKARHEHMDRVVALKLMRREKLSNPDSVRRFYQEVKAAAALVHPNIVMAFDAGQAGATHFISMEFVDGIDLDRLVSKHGPLAVALACDCIRQAALGLQHAHEKGMVHRDVKPSNLLIGQADGQLPVVKVLDLGLARLNNSFSQERKLTRMGQMLGTPDYLAPEQALDARNVDIRADVYSLGCTLFFLLTGRAPFQAEALAELLLKHQMDPPPSIRRLRPKVPETLDTLLQRMMAKKPEQRPATPAEVAAALAPFARGERIGSEQTSPVPIDRIPPVSRYDIAALTEMDEDAGLPGRRHSRERSTRPQWPDRDRDRPGTGSKRAMLLLAVGIVAGLLVVGIIFAALLSRPGNPDAGAPLAVSPNPDGVGKPRPKVDLPEKEQKPPDKEKVEPRLPEVPPVRPQWGAAAERTLTTPFGGQIRNVCFSNDGTKALSAFGLEVVVHDLRDGKILHAVKPANASLVSVAASKDFKRVVSINADNVLRLWDMEAGKVVAVLADKLETFHHVIAVSPDGKYALSAGGGTVHRNGKPVRDAAGKDVLGDFEVRLWDLDKGKEEHRFGGSTWHTQSVSFTDDGKYVVASSHDFPLRVWELKSKNLVHAVRAPTPDWVHEAVRIVPAGKSLVLVGRNDGSVWLWDCAEGKEVRRFTGKHLSAVDGLSVSADGKTALTIAGGSRSIPGREAKNDLTVRVWDVDRGVEVRRVELSERPLSVAISPDGKSALIGLQRAIRYVELEKK